MTVTWTSGDEPGQDRPAFVLATRRFYRSRRVSRPDGQIGTLLASQPMFAGPIAAADSSVLRPHHLTVCVKEDKQAPLDGEHGTARIETVRRLLATKLPVLGCLWSDRFFKDWAILEISERECEDYGIVIADDLKGDWSRGNPVIFFSAHLFRPEKPKRGNYGYSPDEQLLHQVIASQVYRMTRTITGVLQVAVGLELTVAEVQACEIIMPRLEDIRAALRRREQQNELRSKDKQPWNWTFFERLRHDLAPPFLRGLYGEPVETSGLHIGEQWLAQGQELGARLQKYRRVETVTRNLPDLLLPEFVILDKLMHMALHASRVHRDGDRATGRVYVEQGVVPSDAARTIAGEPKHNSLNLPGDIAEVTELALRYAYNAANLFPQYAYMEAHLYAAVAIGRYERLHELPTDPIACWGVRGLIDEQREAALDDSLVEARAMLRQRLTPEFTQAALAIEVPVLSRLDRELVRAFARGHQLPS